jgi:hypothetical protein
MQQSSSYQRLFLQLVLLVLGCGGRSDATSPPEGGTASPPEGGTASPSGDAATLSVTANIPTEEAVAAELARKWQGEWVVHDPEYTGSVQAWSVRGDHVTVYDAGQRVRWEGSFSLRSPCHVARTRQGDGGPNDAVTTTDTFVFASDGLHVGMGATPGGFRRGSLVTACVGDHVYTFDASTGNCQRWNETMTGDPLTPDTECAIAVGVGNTAFVLRRFEVGSDVRLTFDGDALLSPTLAAQVAEPQPSFGAAVQRADALGKH